MDLGSEIAERDNWGEPVSEPLPKRSNFLRNAVRSGIAAACIGFAAVGYWQLKKSATAGMPDACREALRAKDWERLDELAAQWSWWQPGEGTPIVHLAESAFQRGAFERASYLLDQLPDTDPITPTALVEQSAILFGPLNQPIRAGEVLERALRLDPKNFEARRRLVFFYAFTLQRNKMAAHIREAIRNGADLPETYVYLVARDWLSFSNAYTITTKWSLDHPDEELFLVPRAIFRVLSRGLDYSENPVEDPATDKGIPYHQQIIAEYFQRFPQNLELMVYHLEMATTQGDVEGTVRLLSRAPKAAAADGRFWRYKGWVHSARGEFQEAKVAFEKAMEINPYDYRSQHQMASVERSLGNLEQVKLYEDRSQQGTALRKDILIMDSVDNVPPDILKRIFKYAESCGDNEVAGRLLVQLKEWVPAWLDPRADRPAADKTKSTTAPGNTR
jgi:tetratricopeptide (TPR) repeat protein